MKRFFSYEFFIGWRYTRSSRVSNENRFISFISMISMLGIALGVAALIVILSVMNGFQKEVRDRMLSVVSHIEIQSGDGGFIADANDLIGKIKQQQHVVGAATFIASQGLLTAGDSMRGVMVRGIDPILEPTVIDLIPTQVSPKDHGTADEAMQNKTMLQAQSLQILSRLKEGEFGIVLGVHLARALGVDEGQNVTLLVPSANVTPVGTLPRYKQMSVVGIFSTGHYEYDSTLAMVHLSDAQQLFQLEGPSGIRVKLDDLHQARKVSFTLGRVLPQDENLYIRDWTDQNRTWFAAVQVEKRMMAIILTLIIAVAAFNLVSSLVMTVTEKQADIAILRTLGASPKSIMKIFMIQGVVIGTLGTFFGLVLGLFVAGNIGKIVKFIESLLGAELLPSELYLLNGMPSDIQIKDIVPIVVISLLLAFLATLYPSWRASRIHPAQALRYE